MGRGSNLKQNTDIYICPVCGSSLFRQDRAYRCENKHSFDIAKEGYVNLLIGSSGSHGDDKTMINARRDFLNTGAYEPLREKIFRLSEKYITEGNICDCGCGEGYYTKRLCELPCNVFGIDISKDGVKKAAKIMGECGTGCVGSVYSMPYSDESFVCVYNIFSPLAPEEYKRVLKKDGYLIMAVPRQYHLHQLKEVVYEDVHIKEKADDELSGFELLHTEELEYEFELISNNDIMNLFTMTPYYYTSPKNGVERLKKTERLVLTASFGILIYRVLK